MIRFIGWGEPSLLTLTIPAAVAVDLIAVITLLNVSLNDGVTAAGVLTRVDACIGAVAVAVITYLETRSDHAVAAARQKTGVQAVVGIFFITIITLFAGVQLAVSTGFKGAIRLAAVAIDQVAVIATFNSNL